jgi:hypothetical protein
MRQSTIKPHELPKRFAFSEVPASAGGVKVRPDLANAAPGEEAVEERLSSA